MAGKLQARSKTRTQQQRATPAAKFSDVAGPSGLPRPTPSASHPGTPPKRQMSSDEDELPEFVPPTPLRRLPTYTTDVEDAPPVAAPPTRVRALYFRTPMYLCCYISIEKL
ncbi:uncharacterized protein [Apostichopus japonicus]|uniref:uncharacterized protein n=1 Tax=Stichopus japonicus TaxID=307972 RepID=UPI003AB44933